MKKISLLLLLLLSITATAQFDKAFGIKAGTNYSQFTPDIVIAGIKALDYQGKLGYYIGGFYNFNISEKFSVQPELVFSNQGSKLNNGEILLQDSMGNFTVGTIESKLNEFSILIPVIIRFELSKRLFLEAGPQASYAVKRTEIIQKNPFEPSTEGQKSTNPLFLSAFDKFDAGLNLGIGLDVTEQLDLNLRYALGLLERDNTYKTSVINLGIGFKL